MHPKIIELVRTLSTTEREAVIAYAANEDDLNGILRGNSPQALEHADALDTAIRTSRLKESLVVFSATRLSDVQPFLSGLAFHYPAFISASDAESLTRRYFPGEHSDEIPAQLRITLPAGTQTLFLDAIPEASQSEREYLIGRNALFRLASHRTITDASAIEAIVGSPYRRANPILHEFELTFLEYVERPRPPNDANQ